MLASVALLSIGFSVRAPARGSIVRTAVTRTTPKVMQDVGTNDELEARFRAMETQPTKHKTQPKTSGAKVTDVLMEQLGYPFGLASEVVQSAKDMPLHYMIIDNSGSMSNRDGQRFGVDHTGATKVLDCTRWEELSAEVKAMAELAHITGSRTEFYPINPMGTKPIVISGESAADEVAKVCKKLAAPNNGTPLAEATERVVDVVSAQATALRENGQLACVVIATDGEPNDKAAFKQALAKLLKLPVWLVVRLCTDDEAIVNYYNELDSQLEANMEVLDDLRGEAEEISTAGNRWLAYGPTLQHAREFGMRSSIFDLLDEEKLLPSQIKDFCEALLGVPDLPDPDLNAPGFLAAIDDALDQTPKVFDPLSKEMRPWIDTAILKAWLS